METYITFIKYTDQGIKAIKDGPQRVGDARQAIESLGGRMVQTYLVMGEYDLVSIVEVPDAQTAASMLLALGQQGNARTHSVRAFNEQEMAEIIRGLP